MILQEKISALGKNRVHKILTPDTWVRLDEKVDGSQITFGVFEGNKLVIRSKSKELDLDNPEKMFALAVQSIKERRTKLVPGVTYHAEYLQKPRHNVLQYGRVPKGHLVLFDAVTRPVEAPMFMDMEDLPAEAARIGVDVVPMRLVRVKDIPAQPGESFLGGPAEGWVVKCGDAVATRITAKIVGAAFREVKKDTTSRNRQNPHGDVAITLANRFCPHSRFMKAVQYLRDSGQARGEMSDIPALRKRISEDIHQECAEEIKEDLYQLFRKDIQKQALQGLAAWYEQLLTNDSAYWDGVREATQ